MGVDGKLERIPIASTWWGLLKDVEPLVDRLVQMRPQSILYLKRIVSSSSLRLAQASALLHSAMYNELLEMNSNLEGLVFELDEALPTTFKPDDGVRFHSFGVSSDVQLERMSG